MLLALLPLLGGAAAQFASLSSLIQGSSQGSVSTATPTTSQAAETPATSQVTPVTSQAATPVTSQAATPVTSQLGGAAGGTQSAPQSSLLSNSAGSSSSSATQASTAVPSSSQAPDTPVPGQDTLPPVQWWCADNATYCPGKLLQDVQLSGVFPDSKTFVDKPTNGTLNDTLNAFNQLGTNVTVGGILTFASENFKGEGQELEAVDIEGFNPTPAILNNVTDPLYHAWVQVVHGYWTLLIRQTNETALCPPTGGCSSSLIPLNHTIVVPGGRYREIYYWDSYWILQGLLASELNVYAWNLLQNFMDLVETIGFLPNGGRKYYLNRSQPPVFAQMVHAYVVQTGNVTILDRALPLLDKELEWWATNRTVNVTSPWTNMTHTVAHYAVNNSAPRPEGYVEDYETAFGVEGENLPPLNETQRSDLYAELASGAESGWDYSSRWCREPMLNATDNNPALRTLNVRGIAPVDLNALLASDHMIVAELYDMHAGGGGDNTTGGGGNDTAGGGGMGMSSSSPWSMPMSTAVSATQAQPSPSAPASDAQAQTSPMSSPASDMQAQPSPSAPAKRQAPPGADPALSMPGDGESPAAGAGQSPSATDQGQSPAQSPSPTPSPSPSPSPSSAESAPSPESPSPSPMTESPSPSPMTGSPSPSSIAMSPSPSPSPSDAGAGGWNSTSGGGMGGDNSTSGGGMGDNSTSGGSSPSDKAAQHRAMGKAYADAVLDLNWDAERAYFYDYNMTSSTRSNVYSPAGLWPLWLNITPPGLEGNETMALAIASGQRYILSTYAGVPAVASLLVSGLQWDFPNVWPPHVYTTIRAFETIARLVPNATTLSNVTLPFANVTANQFNLNGAELPPQPPETIGNTSLFTTVTEPWPMQMAIEIANRYLTDAFCSWYSTGGSIPGVLEQLPLSDLNATGTWTPDQAGHMFEKFNVTDPDAAGGGGEYTVQIGFGWTNGVVLWAAGKYGKWLPPPTCPLIPIVANNQTGGGGGNMTTMAGATSTAAAGNATAPMPMTTTSEAAGNATAPMPTPMTSEAAGDTGAAPSDPAQTTQPAMFRGYRIPRS